jgi:hypothetical protein
MSRDLHNPYWDAVKDHAKKSEWPWGQGQLEIERFNMDGPIEIIMDRDEYVGRYAWTVTDPDSVAFVAEHCPERLLVDPMAGTGYWAYVLGQLGIDVVCYDQNPPGSGGNGWHSDEVAWVPVDQMACADSVPKHPDRVMLLAWPPFNMPAGYEALAGYQGHKVIYIGESDGCTGTDEMREILEDEWTEVACHQPVQWWGLHDRIYVYERMTK